MKQRRNHRMAFMAINFIYMIRNMENMNEYGAMENRGRKKQNKERALELFSATRRLFGRASVWTAI